jgi:hypothetical protein
LGARSRRLLMVITREPTQSLTALHGPGAADACIAGEQQDVVLPLMIALSMVMPDVFAQGAPPDSHRQLTHLAANRLRESRAAPGPTISA